MTDIFIHCFACASRRGIARILAPLLGLAAASAAVAGDVSLRRIALVGDPAPGTGADVRFSAFTTALNHNIMHPVMDEAGRVAFIAIISGPGVNGSNNSGIWAENNGTLTLVVRTGEAAPGTPPGVFFFGVPSNFLPFPPLFAGGRAAFQGELTGEGVTFSNSRGVWKQGPAGEIELVARAGNQAPGTPPGTTFRNPGPMDIDPSGAVVLISELSGNGVSEENDDALWTDRTGALELIIREGDPAPGTPQGVVIGRGILTPDSTFPGVAANDESRLVIAANLLGADVTSFNDEALFLESASGELQLALREGDQAPGLPRRVTIGGNSVLTAFRGLVMDDAGEIAFTCRLGGAIETTTAMFSSRGGALHPEVLPGDPAPGTDFDFTGFGQPALSKSGRLAFSALLPDDDNDPFTNKSGIWWDQPGDLSLLVLPGDRVRHRGNELTVLSAGSIVGFNANGVLAFRASLDDPETGYTSALLLSDADGAISVVAATGDFIDVNGRGDLREVVRVVPGGLSESGEVAVRLDFTDGTSGHFAGRLGGGCDACDANCDGTVDAFDIEAFVNLLTGGGGCAPCSGDVNGDGAVDAFDIEPFVACLSGP